MAIVKIQNATVTRLNNTGNGLTLLESNESAGKTYKTFYKVWFKEPHGLVEGQTVSLSGFLGAKIGEPWTDREGNTRQSVELSVNNPKLDGATPSAPATAPADEPWAVAGTYNDETPF